jgi:diguanylate cyclase (GGDEF)-like protein/PAS domain S-box-containing protein
MVTRVQEKLNLIRGIDKQHLVDIKTSDGEGVFAVDNEGLFLYMNEQAEHLLGWSSIELQEKNLFSKIDFKTDGIASIGGSPCAAINSVNCAHLQKDTTVIRQDKLPLTITYLTIPIFEKGKMIGKAYVFREAEQTNRPLKEDFTYRVLVESSSNFIVKLDTEGTILYANDCAKRVFGTKLKLAIPNDIKHWLADSKNERVPLRLTNHGKNQDGRIMYVSWSISPLNDASGLNLGAVLMGNDITYHEQKNIKLMEGKTLVHKAFDHISDGIITLNKNGHVTYMNPSAEQLTGWNSADAEGLQLKDVFHVVDEKSHESVVESLIDRSYKGQNINISSTCLLVRRDGWEFVITESSTPVHDLHNTIIGVAITFRDISELHGMERWMAFEPPHDELTGLMNRKEFESHLSKAITSAKATSTQHALCYVNLNGYADFKNKQGEKASSELIKQLASLLSVKVREIDVLGRLEEDAFAVLQDKCPIDNAYESAQALCNEINDFKFIWNDTPLEFSVSIGLVPITAASGGVEALIKTADVACYVASRKGYKKIHAYKAIDISYQENNDDLAWMHKIRRALADDQFRLYCQSIVPIKKPDTKVLYHEILLRLEQENGEVVEPQTFLPVAERYNLMPSIDRWVVRNTLELLKDRIQKEKTTGIFAINISAQSLDDESFLDYVVDKFVETKVPPDNLCFELTETTVISNLENATKFISVLKKMGSGFSLDDFGHGFSSYNYLKNLKINYLKIDGAFVADMANDKIDFAMVQSINQIGHTMGVETIAECVESKHTLEKLMTLGVDHVQGYQIGKPMPLITSTPRKQMEQAVAKKAEVV